MLQLPASRKTPLHPLTLPSTSTMSSTVHPTDDFGVITTTVNYGPLTTIFTPPPSCSTLLLKEYGELEAKYGWFGFHANWGVKCTTDTSNHLVGEIDSSCFPEGWFRLWRSSTGTATTHAFSPGLFCPYGWATVYTVNRHEGFTSSFSLYGLQDMWEMLKAGQTAVMCCPT
jgi:hypothetical protein